MRFERVSNNQFTIFLTFDDLIERGFTKDDLWYDGSNVRKLFSDMMYEASSELGFDLEGALLVQVHLMQAQGMHVIVTQKFSDADFDTDFVEMKVTLDENKKLLFSFHDFENVIDVVSYLSALTIEGGKLYYMNHAYYMLLNDHELNGANREDIIAIMSEFAQPSILTTHRLQEYGKEIFSEGAVKKIIQLFYSKR
ncbi:genetic competence negative regulator [Cerasibacillus sp. JNUCC 74]